METAARQNRPGLALPINLKKENDQCTRIEKKHLSHYDAI
jgi:hypothetical protein